MSLGAAMYIPPAYAETDLPTLHAFVAAHPFGALVTATPDAGLFATHLPLVLDRSRGALGVLEGHVSRANVHARIPGGACDALVIFTGAQAYVSPSHYATKTEHGRVVPTWNYVAVHARGVLRLVEDAAFLERHLAALTDIHEHGRAEPWAMHDAPRDFLDAQLRGIVGVTLEIATLEGKWKLSQNRSRADVEGVIAGLAASDAQGDRAVAEEVARAHRARRSRDSSHNS